MDLFNGRKDVFARFWQNSATKKSGYAPAKDDNGTLLQLTETNVATHLAGQQLIGIYPLLKDNTSHFMAIDFDEASWMEDSVKVMEISIKNSIPCYLERSKSGNGAHLWFFFEKPIPAFKSRQLAKYLISQAGLSKDESSFDRIFPNQDQHTGKGYGNLIALPLNMTYLQKENTAFINQNGEMISDQWHYLASIQKICESKIEQMLGEAVLTFPVEVKQKSQKQAEDVQKSAEPKTEPAVEAPEIKTTQGIEARMILESSIYIPEAFLPDKLYKFLKEKLIFHNPQFYEMERRGYSTWNTPRLISTLKNAEGGILIPAGFLVSNWNICHWKQYKTRNY